MSACGAAGEDRCATGHKGRHGSCRRSCPPRPAALGGRLRLTLRPRALNWREASARNAAAACLAQHWHLPVRTSRRSAPRGSSPCQVGASVAVCAVLRPAGAAAGGMRLPAGGGRPLRRQRLTAACPPLTRDRYPNPSPRPLDDAGLVPNSHEEPPRHHNSGARAGCSSGAAAGGARRRRVPVGDDGRMHAIRNTSGRLLRGQDVPPRHQAVLPGAQGRGAALPWCEGAQLPGHGLCWVLVRCLVRGVPSQHPKRCMW